MSVTYAELVKRLREPCQYENCVLCQQAADAIEQLSAELECLKSYMGVYKAAYIKEHDDRMMDYKSDKEQEASENWKRVMERVGEPPKEET